MIQDYLENADSYRSLGASMQKAFDFLESGGSKGLTDGRHDIDGDEVFALVQSYETQPAEEKRFEAHRRYIDLQYVAIGSEAIVWAPMSRLKGWDDYSEESDSLLCSDGDGVHLTLDEGSFAVLFPQDAHKPGCVWNHPGIVKKVVVKIRC